MYSSSSSSYAHHSGASGSYQRRSMKASGIPVPDNNRRATYNGSTHHTRSSLNSGGASQGYSSKATGTTLAHAARNGVMGGDPKSSLKNPRIADCK